MRFLKFTLIAILTLNNLSCQKDSINDKLNVCLKEPKFHSWFKICEKEIDTICIYDNTKKIDNFIPIKLSCNKVLTSQKSSIKIDLNVYDENNTDKIVLFKYEVKTGIHKLYFLNILNNANMTFELNSENKIVNHYTGFY